MANVIVEIKGEIARVRALLPKFDVRMRDFAGGTIKSAEWALAMNAYQMMREAIEDLKEFQEPGAAPAPGGEK